MTSPGACFEKKACEYGFTLLEVLVSLAVISIALVSVIRLQSQTISMTEAVKFYSAAPFLAQSVIEEAVSDPGSYTDGQSGDFDQRYPGLSWRVEINEAGGRWQESESEEMQVAEITAKITSKGPGAMTYTVSRYHLTENGGF